MNEMESQNEIWTGVLGQGYGDTYSRTGTFSTGVSDGLLGIANNVISQVGRVAAARATFAGGDGRTYSTPVNRTPLQQQGGGDLHNFGGLLPLLMIGAVVYLVATA